MTLSLSLYLYIYTHTLFFTLLCNETTVLHNDRTVSFVSSFYHETNPTALDRRIRLSTPCGCIRF